MYVIMYTQSSVGAIQTPNKKPCKVREIKHLQAHGH